MTQLTEILNQARAGNFTRAWALFVSSGWDAKTDDPGALTLEGRLPKDQANLSNGAERKGFYGDVAVALLLQHEETGARVALSVAIERQPRALEDRATTIGQFELILKEQSGDTAWLDRHPACISAG